MRQFAVLMVSTSLLLLLMRLRLAASACSTSLHFNGSLYTFVNCLDLSVQGASLAWTLVPSGSSVTSISSSGTASSSPASSGNGDGYLLEVAFSGTAPSSSGWVGWGLNPNSPQMVGTSAFLAYSASNGSTLLPYRLTTATIAGTPLACSPIDYAVQAAAVEISGASMSMFLAIQLNASQPTTLNHVWNRGPSVTKFQPAAHGTQPENLESVTQIDMSTGLAVNTVSPIQILKIRHAVINTVAWGILLPAGVMFARYFKPFADSMWFYMHISLQCIGYVLGVSGWATGLKLESATPGFVLHKHKNIAMALFAFSTLQVMALLVRPKREHKLRTYWNIYHHSIGYCVIVLGIMNVFVGFAILLPKGIWPHAYICGLAALGGIALLLEIATWFVFFQKRTQERSMRAGAAVSDSRNKTINGTFGPTEHVLRVL